MGGTDLFVCHGYTLILVDGRWLKASPAFNAELCARFGLGPVDFDGESDAFMHPFTADGARHMLCRACGYADLGESAVVVGGGRGRWVGIITAL